MSRFVCVFFVSSPVLTFISCNRCGFRIGTVARLLTIMHILNLIYRRARKKIKAGKLTTQDANSEPKRENLNGIGRGMDSVQTEPDPPHLEPREQLNGLDPSLLSDINPLSPSSSVTTNGTLSHWAEPNALPKTSSDPGLVSPLCYRPLPVPSQKLYTHSLDPSPFIRQDFIDGCQLLTLHHRGIDGGSIQASLSESSNV